MFPQGGGGRLCKPTPQTPVFPPLALVIPPPGANTHLRHISSGGGGRIQTSAPHVLAIWGLGEVYVFNILLGVCVRAWSLETTSAGGDITRPSCLERKEQN